MSTSVTSQASTPLDISQPLLQTLIGLQSDITTLLASVEKLTSVQIDNQYILNEILRYIVLTTYRDIQYNTIRWHSH